jgi:VRR-NUC domain
MPVVVLSRHVREKDWQQTVIEAATYAGWLHYHTQDSRGSDPGFPDLVLVRPPRVLFVELKTDAGRIQPAQRLWLTALEQCGTVEVYVWRPRDDWGTILRILA